VATAIVRGGPASVYPPSVRPPSCERFPRKCRSLSGSTFEQGVEADLGQRFRTVQYAAKYSLDHNRPANNAEVTAEARKPAPGEAVLLFQPRLEAELHGWLLRGDVDLLRLERPADGTLHALIGDMKSTTEVKVEHRLQVAFYRLMLERLLKDAGLPHLPIQTGILFRPPADPTPEEEAAIKPLWDAAKEVFGLGGSLLEVVADPDAYAQSAHDLVLGQDSTARRVAGTPFEQHAPRLHETGGRRKGKQLGADDVTDKQAGTCSGRLQRCHARRH
jgi:hypothetical protein